MPALEQLAWCIDAGHGDWLAARLGDHSSNVVTDIVPSGFDAYARLLHPASDPSPGGRRAIRWRDVAAWSGQSVEPDAPFHAVALPAGPVATPPPWSEEGPRRGSLAPTDAETLIPLVRRHTRTPDDCWFCLWDGFDWIGAPLPRHVPLGNGTRVDDPVPAAVRAGPRVELPGRNYFLYRGPVESASVRYGAKGLDRTANLWWPEDRAWCVATDIDLSSTYVGGPVALVRALVADPGLEAVEVAPDAPVAAVEPRITALVQPAVDSLLDEGHGTVVTPVGTVEAHLRLPRWMGRGSFRYTAESARGKGFGGSHTLRVRRHDRLAVRETVARYLQDAVVGLVGG